MVDTAWKICVVPCVGSVYIYVLVALVLILGYVNCFVCNFEWIVICCWLGSVAYDSLTYLLYVSILLFIYSQLGAQLA